MGIPTVNFRKCDFQTYVGFDQAADLRQTRGETPRRVVSLTGGDFRLDAPQLMQSGEKSFAAGAKERIRAVGVELFQRPGYGFVARAKLIDGREGQRRRAAGEDVPLRCVKYRFNQPSGVLFSPGVPISM